MDLYNNLLYAEDVAYVASLSLPWDMLAGKNMLISGATGMVGKFLVDVITRKNLKEELGCKIFAMSRSIAKDMLSIYGDDARIAYLAHDVNDPLPNMGKNTMHYVLHLASNTHPLQYATDPIGTIMTNVIGLQNMLNFAAQHNVERFVFASSNEIYGENRGDVECFGEDYCGYIDSNTLRAGYPESKRCGEALCQAYIKQKNIDIVIPRLTRTYGPTMRMSDSKAVSQFIKKAIAGEDIVLKSAGAQFYSYQYVADTVSGILTVMMLGKTGEAYNIADENSDITLKDLAGLAAKAAQKNVIYEMPDDVEASGYSKATKARLNGEKLMSLGWKPRYGIEEGIQRTIEIMRSSLKSEEPVRIDPPPTKEE